MAIDAPILPPAPRFSIAKDDDPYKRVWMLILGGFVLTAIWLYVPLMGAGTGEGRINSGGNSAAAVEQNLEVAEPSNGAPGSALGAMDGKLASLTPETPSQSPLPGDSASAGAAGAASANAAGSSSADVSKGAPSNSKTSSSRRAAKPFNPPHLSNMSLSGPGSVSGGAGASYSGGAAFGNRATSVGYTNARGLHDDGTPAGPAGRSLTALNAGARSATNANVHGFDATAAALGHTFDGSAKQKSGGPAPQVAADLNSLNEIPKELKQNDPDLMSGLKKIDAPAPAMSDASSNNKTQQLVMMFAAMAVGGLIPGVGGQMAMMMMMTMMQK